MGVKFEMTTLLRRNVVYDNHSMICQQNSDTEPITEVRIELKVFKRSYESC